MMRYLVQNEDQGYTHCAAYTPTIEEARKFKATARACGAKKVSIYDTQNGWKKVR